MFKGFDWIQNITERRSGKTDDCNAAHELVCPFTHASTTKIQPKPAFHCQRRVGINVAHLLAGLGKVSETVSVLEGDFDHAVDNSGDSFGLVVNWIVVTRGWRSYPPAAGGRRCYFDHQPRDWPPRCLSRAVNPRR